MVRKLFQIGTKRVQVLGATMTFRTQILSYSMYFFFFENELILQSKVEETKGKPAKQEREAYQIEQLDLRKGG